MNYDNYKKYISADTMMGPNSVRILEALFNKCTPNLNANSVVVDLGCGKGLTSLVIAKETGAKVYANDLWVKAEENKKQFEDWGVDNQIIPVCEDANDLHFDKGQFDALFSIDSYHYFAGKEGFFQEKIMPFIKNDGVVLIGVPGIKDKYSGQSEELLSDWLGDDAYMLKSPSMWEKIIGKHDRIKEVKTWELDCFDNVWGE